MTYLHVDCSVAQITQFTSRFFIYENIEDENDLED